MNVEAPATRDATTPSAAAPAATELKTSGNLREDGDRTYSLYPDSCTESDEATDCDDNADADSDYGFATRNGRRGVHNRAREVGGGASRASPAEDFRPRASTSERETAAFSMQAAAEYDDLSDYLPSHAVVNALFAPHHEFSPAECDRLLQLRHDMEEDMMALQLFVQRLDTPSLLAWVETDRVILPDVLQAALHLKGTLQRRISALLPAGKIA